MIKLNHNSKFCVLIGKVGSGKTTVFNKVCGTYHKTDFALDS